MARKITVKKMDMKSVGKSMPAVVSTPDVKTADTMVETPEKQVTHQEIAAKAKEIWISRGLPWGQDLEIWLEAERVLRG